MKHQYLWRHREMATTETGGSAAIIKEIGTLAAAQKEQTEAVKTQLQKSLEDTKGELQKSIDKLEEEMYAKSAKVVKDEMTKFREEQEAKAATNLGGKPETKSFNEYLTETIEANADKIKNFKTGAGEERFEMKSVGDMSITANFPSANTLFQDVRNQLIETPYNRTWLADLLPQGTSGGTSIIYPKENGGEGGAALWTDKTTDKPEMDFDLTSQSAFFKWLAGIVIVDREMLDDIPFLMSYLQRKMLISLKTAENTFVLSGSADTNPVTGILAAATAYDGTYTKPVERILDAAWGQLVEGTQEAYNPTNVILTPRNSVAIGLNTATGSGEYDLPPGSVGFVNGQLTIGGLQTVKTTSVGAGNFIAFDKNALMFVRRMAPELRLFEDAALAKKNKVMFRIEERATLAIFNNKAIIKGTLEAA